MSSKVVSKARELEEKLMEFQRLMGVAPELPKPMTDDSKQVLSTFEKEVDKILSDKTRKAMVRPLRCGIGWHKWSVWACEEDVGDLYTIRQQRRVCLCCALVDARSIYKDDD